jgi:hypothetical protein
MTVVSGSRRVYGLGLSLGLWLFAGCGSGDAPADRPSAQLPRFGPAVNVESPAGSGAGEPWLFVEPDGGVLMSWLEPSVEGQALRFSVLDGGGWGPVRTVVSRADLFVNWADFPSAIRLPDASLAVHWLQRTGPDTYAYGVRLSRSTDEGQTWSVPVTPHTDETQTEHGFVTLSPGLEAGSVRAVWLDGRNYADPHADPAFMTLRHAEISADGSLTSEVELDSRTCDCCQTSTAVTRSGIVVAYRGRTRDEIRDIRVVRSGEQGWSSPSVVHADGWVIPSCPVNGPAIAATGNLVAVAWFTAANDSPRVMLAFSDDGGESFEAPIQVAGSGEIGRSLGRVDLALNPDGVALVSWLHEREGIGALMLAAFDSNGSRSGTTVVPHLDGGRATGFPRMALRSDDILFAWTEPGDTARIRMVSVPLVTE